MDDPNTIIKLKYIFPLVLRPFGQLWLPTPRKPREIFKFDPFDYCKGHFWDHKNEKTQDKIKVKCDDLKHIYPFVQLSNQSTSIEILKTNHSIIHTIIFN